MKEITWKGLTFSGVCTDNREVTEGDLFFAFPGETHDGHEFVKDALARGACACVVSKEIPGIAAPARLIRVDDTIKAYGELASAYRALFDIPVVGITGSVGKTTTKDLVAAVLSESFRTTATKGNFNNHIGLPGTVLSLEEGTQAAVFEMGMNHAGEISYLTNIARPTIATITNIGDAHIGLLGSRENIFKAKAEIFEGLSADGLFVLNADDEYLVRILKDDELCRGRTIITIGECEDATLRAVEIEETAEGVLFRIEERSHPAGAARVSNQVLVPLFGRHIIYPALTAYAIGRHLGMEEDAIFSGFTRVVTSGRRMEVTTRADGVTILNDTYNANPQSMMAALRVLAERPEEKRIAVLGDMYELGEEAVRLHETVGACAATLRIDTLVCVGALASHIARAARENGMTDVVTCEDKDTAAGVLKEILAPGSAVLFKASRGMALEELI